MQEITLDDLYDEPSKLSPTAEQLAILEAAKSSNKSMMIRAYAGCSKTSTIEILARSLPPRPSCYVVFNKKNKEEAEKKFKSPSSPWAHLGRADHVNVVTLNGLGHNAWAKSIGKRLILKTDKIHALLKQILIEDKVKNFSKEDFITVLSLVRRARVNGLIPEPSRQHGLLPDTDDSWQAIADSLWLEGVSEEHFYLARRLLTQSIVASYAAIIDFDDQIYMSALFGGVFPRYQVLYGDETQDYSVLNQKQVAFTAADRLFLVGDERQAIYAFRGADSESMDSLRSLRKEWIDMPLTTTFRCPKAVVARQQNHAPGFQAWKDNAEGIIEHWNQPKSEDAPNEPLEWTINRLPPGEEVAILCRNNAPLFKAALNCLRSGRGCTLLGSEIGRGLITLARSIESDENAPIERFLEKVCSWQETEFSKAIASGKEAKASIIQDKAECLIEVASGLSRLHQLLGRLIDLFEPSEVRITLCTGHKAKGLEWDNVILLDPWRIPSKYAKQQAEAGDKTSLVQDLNLRYVMETRAKKRLIFANSEHMK